MSNVAYSVMLTASGTLYNTLKYNSCSLSTHILQGSYPRETFIEGVEGRRGGGAEGRRWGRGEEVGG